MTRVASTSQVIKGLSAALSFDGYALSTVIDSS